MPRVQRIILDTATYQPQHRFFLDLARWLSTILNVELKIIEEDYVFANQYGDKDEFGFAWLPQLFVELESGNIIPVLTRPPFNPQTLELDQELSKKEIISRLRENGIEVQV
ncbi:MAG: hypothetical protein RQ885_12980 [Desulfurococcales archaeon]|jgi:hypothetical protein|nr:hypothetical protein [Desulfurococcales archaeon]